MAGRLAWFLTPAARKLAKTTAIATACVVGGVTFLPHTFLAEQHRDFVALRKGKTLVPLPQELQKLFNEVLDDLTLVDDVKSVVRPFMVFGFDMYHLGSLIVRPGVYIGMPLNFTYTDVSKVKRDLLYIDNEPVDWERTDAQNLLSSLILSDEAKKYAIAREYLVIDNPFIIFNTLNSSLMLYACHALAAKFNDQLKLFEKPRLLRLCFYTLICTFVWGIWILQKDTMIRYYEQNVDEYLAKLDEKYIKGAIEYYEKKMERNKALKALLGYKGAAAFNNDGDVTTLIRKKHLPLSNRKEFFENKLKEYFQNKEETVQATEIKVAVN